MSNEMQPKISRQEWESYHNGRMVRLNADQKGAGRIEILNSFFVENQDINGNEGLFGDTDAQGLTKENAQNMYNKLVEIHQRRGDGKDVNNVKYGSHLYYTKEELTELAEAGGYKVPVNKQKTDSKPNATTNETKQDAPKEKVSLGYENAGDNLTFEEFQKINKEVQNSDVYKSLPYSAPEKQAFYKWQNDQYERLRGNGISTKKSSPKSKPTERKQVDKNDEIQQKSLDDAIAKSMAEATPPVLTPYVDTPFDKMDFTYDDNEATAEEIAEETPAVNEATTEELADETPAVDESTTEEVADETPAVDETTTEEVADETPAVDETTTEEVADETPAVDESTTEEVADETPAVDETTTVKTPSDKLNEYYQTLDKSYKDAAEEILKPVRQGGNIEGYINIVKDFSAEQFAKAFGNTTVEDMANDLGVTPQELTSLIKNVDENSFKMFLTYGQTKLNAADNAQEQEVKEEAATTSSAKETSQAVQLEDTPTVVKRQETKRTENTTAVVNTDTPVSTKESKVKEQKTEAPKSKPMTPPRAKVKRERENIDTKNPLQYDDYKKIGTTAVNSLTAEELNEALDKIHGMDINEFASRYGGVKTGEEFAKKLGVSTDDLETLVKTMDKNGLAYFVGYKQQANITQTVIPDNPTGQSVEDIATYINGREDLKDLDPYSRRNILQNELNELIESSKDDYTTKAKIEQLKKAIAYGGIYWSSKMNERDGTTYFERVDEKTGAKVVDRIKRGTINDIEGTYGVKFIEDPANPRAYKLVPDWDNKLN